MAKFSSCDIFEFWKSANDSDFNDSSLKFFTAFFYKLDNCESQVKLHVLSRSPSSIFSFGELHL